MLRPAKIKIFALMSILMHMAFALLFAKTTLSFPPPPMKTLSLAIIIREGAKSEIIQSEAAWPTPERAEPEFSVDISAADFEAEAVEWIYFQPPDPSLFEPLETLTPAVDFQQLAAKAYEPPPEEMFSHQPPEMKTMPATLFALGPAAPEILGTD
jgi:hypothetical protein